MLDDDTRALLGGSNIGHLATLLKDGAPHSVRCGSTSKAIRSRSSRSRARSRPHMDRDGRVALSITHRPPADSAVIRGRVSERLEGDPAWEIVDRMSQKNEGMPYW